MESTVKELDSSHADYIHFDVMDGDFVPNLTFGPQFISNIRKYSNKVFDVHLMINRVEKFLDEYIKSGSDIITFHLEIDENISIVNDNLKKFYNNFKSTFDLWPKFNILNSGWFDRSWLQSRKFLMKS